MLKYDDVNALVTRDMEGMNDRDIADWITELVLQLCRKDEDMLDSVIEDIKEMQELDNA